MTSPVPSWQTMIYRDYSWCIKTTHCSQPRASSSVWVMEIHRETPSFNAKKRSCKLCSELRRSWNTYICSLQKWKRWNRYRVNFELMSMLCSFFSLMKLDFPLHFWNCCSKRIFSLMSAWFYIICTWLKIDTSKLKYISILGTSRGPRDTWGYPQRNQSHCSKRSGKIRDVSEWFYGEEYGNQGFYKCDVTRARRIVFGWKKFKIATIECNIGHHKFAREFGGKSCSD